MSDWFQVFGRLHPLVLHLPIGLFAALAALEVWALASREPMARRAVSILAWITACSAVLAATTGYVLSREDTYGGPTLVTHMRLGIAVASSSVLLATVHAWSRRGIRIPLLRAYQSFLFGSLVLLLFAGHFGSTMTHGKGFLTEPLHASEDAAPPAQVPSTYDVSIAPFFAARCTSCHGETKKKSGLALHEPASILAGGKRGPVIVAGKPKESELLRRLLLPLADEDHMPPEDKPQPTAEELRSLEAWVAAGAPFSGVVGEGEVANPPASGLTLQASSALESTASIGPSPADPAALAALQAALVHAEPIAQGSPLLWVDFAGAAARTTDDEATLLLSPVLEQVAELSLARCAITEHTLSLVARMPNLRRLDLRGSQLTSISPLAGHPRLEELVLAQTRLTDAAVADLLTLPALRQVYLWQAGVSAEGIVRLQTERSSLGVDTGEAPGVSVLEAEQEVILTKPALPSSPPEVSAGALSPVNTACPVTGSPVKEEFRVIFGGRVIGFCCPHCPSKFLAEPESFASKLP